jgi:hypothetical protein
MHFAVETDILGTGQLWRRAYADHRQRQEAAALTVASIASAGVAAFGLLLSVI